MDLTDNQLTLWKELGSQLSAPPDLRQQALTFYTHYHAQESWSPQKTCLVLRVAYFLSEKAQLLFDAKGHRIRGIALSANTILRDHPQHEEFLYHLKQMLRTVPIPAHADNLEQEVTIFSKQMSFSLTFLSKLRTTLKRIRVNQKNESSADYSQELQKILWLIFVDCRYELCFGLDIVTSTCLLSCVFCFFLVEKYRQEGVFSIYFELDGEGTTLGNEEEDLTQIMQGYFHIKDSASYQHTQQQFKQYLANLSQSLDIRRPFSQPHMQRNIYLLQRSYSKRINDDHLDQSTFIRNCITSNKTPVKMTPFGRRPLMAPRNMSLMAQRILTYEMTEDQIENKVSGENKQNQEGLKVIKLLKNQPTPKGVLIRATPMSEAMEMYNWLYEKSNRFSISKQDYFIIQQTLSCCLKADDPKINILHTQLAGGLWKQTLLHERQQEDITQALLFVSVHLTCHVLNAPQYDLKESMNKTNQKAGIIWRALDKLLNFDKNMPLALKLYLYGLQQSFINSKLWDDAELVEQISLGTEGKQQRLFKRVLHQAALQIHFVSNQLQFSQQSEDSAFLILQQSLKSKEKMLLYRSLSHLVLCSIYAAARVVEFCTKFSHILQIYKTVVGVSTCHYQNLVNQVLILGQKGSIITFYNEIFVPELKPFLKLIRTKNVEELSAGDTLINSSIRKIMPKGASSLLTPQMASYFAYNQSPILRPKLRDISHLSASINTAWKEHHYSLQDISAKFGKSSVANTLKDTRKIKR